MDKLDDFWRAELASYPDAIKYIEFLEECLDKLYAIGQADDYHGLWDVIETYQARQGGKTSEDQNRRIRRHVETLKVEFISWRQPPIELPPDSLIERVVRRIMGIQG